MPRHVSAQDRTDRPRNYRHLVQRRTALKLPLLLAAGAALAQTPRATAVAGRWSAERANTWYQTQGWIVGANYITANAINQLEMFQPATYDPRRIDRELGLARLIGFNSMRVFLHDQLWASDQRGFQTRLAQFVAIAARHGIKPLFVLFDSCWDPFPKLGQQRAPRPGVHNSGWVQSPGAEHLGDPSYQAVLHGYVTGVLNQFRNDNRVLGWDLWNEPDNPAKVYRKVERKDKLERVAELLPQVFQWAREVDPSQPLTSGVWQGNWSDPGKRSTIASIQLDNADVITFHSYAAPAGLSTNLRRWGGRSSAPSTWRAPRAAVSRGCYQSPSVATSAPSIGVWSPVRLRPTYRGIPGIIRTPSPRRYGSAIFCNPTDGPTGRAKYRPSSR